MPQSMTPLAAASEMLLTLSGLREEARCQCTERLRHVRAGMIPKSHIELADEVRRIGTPEAEALAAHLYRGAAVQLGDHVARLIAAAIRSI